MQTPTARVTNVAVTKQTSQGARVLVTVQVKNSNDYTLPTVGADYNIEVKGLKPFNFHTIPSKDLPANGSQTFIFPAAFATPNGTISNRTYTITGDITIQPPGKIWYIATQSGWPHPTADFSTKGKFPKVEITPQKEVLSTD